MRFVYAASIMKVIAPDSAPPSDPAWGVEKMNPNPEGLRVSPTRRKMKSLFFRHIRVTQRFANGLLKLIHIAIICNAVNKMKTNTHLTNCAVGRLRIAVTIPQLPD